MGRKFKSELVKAPRDLRPSNAESARRAEEETTDKMKNDPTVPATMLLWIGVFFFRLFSYFMMPVKSDKHCTRLLNYSESLQQSQCSSTSRSVSSLCGSS